MTDNPIPNVSEAEGQSADIVAGNIDKLKEIFPDAFTEGGVDFNTLRQLLGDASVLDEGEEKYGLNWHGKKKARQIALTPSTGTLLPCPEESVDWDTTQNLFIEGDNLEVLKLLQKSYANKVKMIYIDPPYNTGHDFIYPDNFSDSINAYLEMTGQSDSEGKKLTSNKEASGRKHTNWLSMIYPRLLLSKNILAQDGAIFISIDDNELTNLRTLCNDVFGEENFIGTFIWRRRASSAMADNNVSMDQDYVVCYKKPKLNGFLGIEKDFGNYSNPDNDPRGPWVAGDLTVGMTAAMRPNQAYDLADPKSGNVFQFNPNRVWAYIPESMEKMIAEGRVIFPKDTSRRPMQKRFMKELKSTHNPISTLIQERVGLNTEATRTIQQLLGGNLFDYSKPTSLMKLLAEQVCSDGDIVLDFFAGSAATAHSIMDFNSKGEDQVSFIMVQLPEPVEEKSEAYSAGFRKISEISRERIKKAGENLKKTFSGMDCGFRSFRLENSNIVTWNPDKADIETTLLNHKESLVEGRSEQDILYELLLKRGVELTVPIEEKQVNGKTIHSIGYGVLFACLDKSITSDDAEAIAQTIVDWHKELEPETDSHVFFRDSAFADDVTKSNMAAILDQNGISHVRSL